MTHDLSFLRTPRSIAYFRTGVLLPRPNAQPGEKKEVWQRLRLLPGRTAGHHGLGPGNGERDHDQAVLELLGAQFKLSEHQVLQGFVPHESGHRMENKQVSSWRLSSGEKTLLPMSNSTSPFGSKVLAQTLSREFASLKFKTSSPIAFLLQGRVLHQFSPRNESRRSSPTSRRPVSRSSRTSRP